MTKLIVLYDVHCGFCRFCRQWLEEQPAYLDFEFLPAQSRTVPVRFPQLISGKDVEELFVIDDDGGVYRGDRAWIMCLYALKEYREWSLRLAHPRLRSLARWVFYMISENRTRISQWIEWATQQGHMHSVDKPTCRISNRN